jgi:hypothetical protein
MTKPAHYAGSYHVQARQIRTQAYANPLTRCWRCGLTLPQIHQAKPRAKWTAGHLVDGQTGGPLAPECSPCNYAAGARLRNQRRRSPLAW